MVMPECCWPRREDLPMRCGRRGPRDVMKFTARDHPAHCFARHVEHVCYVLDAEKLYFLLALYHFLIRLLSPVLQPHARPPAWRYSAPRSIAIQAQSINPTPMRELGCRCMPQSKNCIFNLTGFHKINVS